MKNSLLTGTITVLPSNQDQPKICYDPYTISQNFIKTPPQNITIVQKDLLGHSGFKLPCTEVIIHPPQDNSKELVPIPSNLYICDLCTSSIDKALELAQENLFPPWSSILASAQSTGRGQLGNQWISPSGNIYGAIRLPLCPLFSTTAAAPAIGAFIVDKLNKLGIQVQLKWPNDIIISNPTNIDLPWLKVGGILLEERKNTIIAGIGINVFSIPKGVMLRSKTPIGFGCLPIHPNIINTPEALIVLWSMLVNHIFFWYTNHNYQDENTTWKDLAEYYLAFKNQPVVIKDGINETQSFYGILQGLDAQGGLCVSIAGKSTTLFSGHLYPIANL